MWSPCEIQVPPPTICRPWTGSLILWNLGFLFFKIEATRGASPCVSVKIRQEGEESASRRASGLACPSQHRVGFSVITASVFVAIITCLRLMCMWGPRVLGSPQKVSLFSGNLQQNNPQFLFARGCREKVKIGL